VDRLDVIEIIFLVCFFALPAWGVIDAARFPDEAWKAAGRSKRFWILIQIVLLYIGAVMYLAGVRRDVRFFTAPISPDWEEED
jgi:predicted membrane-bound dolichyl-phosphate-mannose-protein mannosyltransferase